MIYIAVHIQPFYQSHRSIYYIQESDACRNPLSVSLAFTIREDLGVKKGAKRVMVSSLGAESTFSHRVDALPAKCRIFVPKHPKKNTFFPPVPTTLHRLPIMHPAPFNQNTPTAFAFAGTDPCRRVIRVTRED